MRSMRFVGLLQQQNNNTRTTVTHSLTQFLTHTASQASRACTHVTDYMTAHEACSTVATTFAGGDDGAETEVHDPVVLRLRLARALPPVTGIMWRDFEEGEWERLLLLLFEADISSFSSSFFGGWPAIQAAMPEIFFGFDFAFGGLGGASGTTTTSSTTAAAGPSPVAIQCYHSSRVLNAGISP